MPHLLPSLLACFALAATSSAQVFSGTFPLDSSQEVPPNGSTATGTGTVSLDTSTNVLSWNITYAGLTSPETGAHFHGPAMPGQNAGVQQPLVIGSPIVGSAPVSPGQASDIVNGLWYVNIHTAMFPGGEIRGQVLVAPVGAVPALPLPGMIALGSLLLGAGGILLHRKNR